VHTTQNRRSEAGDSNPHYNLGRMREGVCSGPLEFIVNSKISAEVRREPPVFVAIATRTAARAADGRPSVGRPKRGACVGQWPTPARLRPGYSARLPKLQCIGQCAGSLRSVGRLHTPLGNRYAPAARPLFTSRLRSAPRPSLNCPRSYSRIGRASVGNDRAENFVAAPAAVARRAVAL
jgi:hypothetical protein